VIVRNSGASSDGSESIARPRWERRRGTGHDSSRIRAEASGLLGLEASYACQARLNLTSDGFTADPALHSRRGPIAISAERASILEALAVTSDTRAAFSFYSEAEPASMEMLSHLPPAPWRDVSLELRNGAITYWNPDEPLDSSQCAAGGTSLIRGLLRREGQHTGGTPGLEAFVAGVVSLGESGLVNPRPGHVSLGHLARREPFCQRFGSSRGTVVDRYYLGKFVSRVQHLVRGRTVEVGTGLLTEDHKLTQAFPNVSEYRTLDLLPGPGVDICGDLNDVGLFAPGSLDSILCFNVLEHCAAPQTAVDNMREWLSPGGRVFCMVPSVQRVHEAPNDFWRPLPAGLEHLFGAFSARWLDVYGNLQATIAALAALAAEDLGPGALDEPHPDYPVASCIVAVK
jgi:SAM-dependent methyltransferase